MSESISKLSTASKVVLFKCSYIWLIHFSKDVSRLVDLMSTSWVLDIWFYSLHRTHMQYMLWPECFFSDAFFSFEALAKQTVMFLLTVPFYVVYWDQLCLAWRLSDDIQNSLDKCGQLRTCFLHSKPTEGTETDCRTLKEQHRKEKRLKNNSENKKGMKNCATNKTKTC